MEKIRYFLNDFFRPKIITYSINKSKQEVSEKIKELLNPKTNFLFSSADFTGYCTNDVFELNLISPAYTRGVKYSSTLTGLIKAENEISIIEIQLRHSTAIFGTFFIVPIFGIISFIVFLNHLDSFKYLFWAIALIFGGPFFSIWFSNVSNTTLQERFESFIKKELK